MTVAAVRGGGKHPPYYDNGGKLQSQNDSRGVYSSHKDTY